MLPSSHLAPINVPPVERRKDGVIPERANEFMIDACAAWQQDVKNEAGMQAGGAAILAGEFSEFISAATRLEDSYRKLQGEVSELGLELTERNAALNASLVEIERMRFALQQIVDSMPCGVLVLDRDGQISIINPESRRLLGLGEAHFAQGAKKTLRQISECSGIDLEAAFESASSSEAEQEFCVRDSSGKRWIEVRNRRLSEGAAGSERSDKTILILRDVTAQKRAEQEREAGRKAMALAEITTVLAHEIRNPLASLELFAELIEQDGGNRGEWISNLRAGIRSLSGTVNNVLSFHGAGSLALAPVALSAQIGNAIQFVRPIADQAGVALEFVADDDQVDVMGNESALQQIFLNLLSNAIRHTPAGGKVTVSIRPEGSAVNGVDSAEDSGQIVVQFSDTGCGIRPEQIDRIFEPGFSGGGDTTGLGLAVCERLMNKHGGRISVSNQIESGAIFTLSFPAFQQELVTA
jgi:two-component system sensor histidine kinase FlrB